MEKLKRIDYLTVKELVPFIQQAYAVHGPEQNLSQSVDWFSGVPEGAVPYLNAFRLKYFEYESHINLIQKFSKKKGDVHRIGDLGCGVATHLIKLAKLGYDCVGIDKSDESLELAEKNASEEGVKIKLIKGDIRKVNLKYELDMVISMYVPLSPLGTRESFENAQKFLREGGYFVKVHGNPDPNGVPKQASIYDVDVIENDEFRVARLEHWWINGKIISWNAYYFVRNNIEGEMFPNNVIVFADHNDIPFNRDNDIVKLKKQWHMLGYKFEALYPIHKSKAAPPWTTENLLFLSKI